MNKTLSESIVAGLKKVYPEENWTPGDPSVQVIRDEVMAFITSSLARVIANGGTKYLKAFAELHVELTEKEKE